MKFNFRMNVMIHDPLKSFGAIKPNLHDVSNPFSASDIESLINEIQRPEEILYASTLDYHRTDGLVGNSCGGDSGSPLMIQGLEYIPKQIISYYQSYT